MVPRKPFFFCFACHLLKSTKIYVNNLIMQHKVFLQVLRFSQQLPPRWTLCSLKIVLLLLVILVVVVLVENLRIGWIWLVIIVNFICKHIITSQTKFFLWLSNNSSLHVWSEPHFHLAVPGTTLTPNARDPFTFASSTSTCTDGLSLFELIGSLCSSKLHDFTYIGQRGRFVEPHICWGFHPSRRFGF